MRKFYLLAIIGFLSVRGFSQCAPYLTNREVYDFAVGDTFQYLLQANNGGGEYRYRIILNRNNYGNDSIVYSIQDIVAGFWNHSVDVYSAIQKITQLDSIESMSWTNWTLDSITCSYSSSDSLYTSSFHTWITTYCSGIGQDITSQATEEATYSSGLGITYSWNCSNSQPCNFCSSRTLIYAHRTNGLIYGSPDNSLYTSIESINNQNLVSFSPNPSTTSFTIQLSSSPSTQTYFNLYDALGRPVKREEINTETTTVQRGNLPSGIYFWQLQQADKILERGKVVME